MKILIADDQLIIRKGLQLIVAHRRDWEVAAEASNREELFALLRSGTFDLLVIDPRLGRIDDLELIASLRREHPAVPVLVLSGQPEQQFALRMLRAGAGGYVQKDASADEIVEAIERVAQGRRWVSANVAEQLIDGAVAPDVRRPHDRLSARELEVFRRLAVGENVTAIAAAMNLSVKTVSTYRTRILEKMELHSNADLVAYAIRNGII